MSKKALVLFSGGVDSATCLGLAIEQFGKEHVHALSIYYGQKHEKEIEAAHKVLEYYGIQGQTIDLTAMFACSDSSLLRHSKTEIPKSSYAEQLIECKETLVSTYVPFRNGLFLSAAASIGLSKGCSYLYYGAHRDDAAGNAYPDCSEAFYHAINQAIMEGSGQQIRLEAPFINKNKSQVVKEGLRLKVPYEFTWSCYEGADKPCGVCGTCIDRKKAFEANGIQDPALHY